jgi:ribosome-associated toxin RatA of RatAB toxin-antitoxin module
MDAITVHAHISASREELFDFVSDVAARVSFTDHYAKDFRLANPNSRGVGAAARYLLPAPLNHHYVETRIVEAERPRRLVEATHGGHGGRSRGEVVWELSRAGRNLTEVELTIVWEFGTARERVKEALGTRRWLRRKSKKALERLRVIFEEPRRDPLPRTTVAAYEPLKAPRFGLSSPVVKR